MSHNLPGIEDNNEDILPPEKRIQQLLLLSSKIELNTNIAARKYYRSGREMISMADVYTKENNLEQAYILYMRFMTSLLRSKILTYKQIIRPAMTCGIQIWGAAKKSNINILQSFQSISLRIIIGASWFVSNQSLHNDLQIPTLPELASQSLFLETINEHPDYKNVPIEERNLNYRALREVLPIAENIKTKLLEQYSTQYELYQERKALQEFKEKREKKLLSIEKNNIPSNQNVTQEELNTTLNNATVPELNNTYLNNPTSFESRYLFKIVSRPSNHNLIDFNELNDITLSSNIPTHSNSKIQFNHLKPIVDRSTKPLLNKNTTNPYNLRQIIVPGNLTKRFLEQAQRNTSNNLETCGILAGKLVILFSILLEKYC
ncbi:hypothetical protein AGLY_011243 [Aphis glycines]|uniref:USP8 dimerisation domain-containing protein n=1 Tax=Aphis glycines TaxID=307491 RepID=A0A6G0TF15_APHGL|nr:hypothetical protein AGLY_011243 [Aphis glycines]